MTRVMWRQAALLLLFVTLTLALYVLVALPLLEPMFVRINASIQEGLSPAQAVRR